jgi:hypothetical protein
MNTEQLAFVRSERFDDFSRFQVILMNVKTKKEIIYFTVKEGYPIHYLRYGPKSKTFYFVYNFDLSLLDDDCKDPKPVTGDFKERVTIEYDVHEFPKISSFQFEGLDLANNEEFLIFHIRDSILLDLKSGLMERLYFQRHPSFSPDDDYIISDLMDDKHYLCIRQRKDDPLLSSIIVTEGEYPDWSPRLCEKQ